jgi:hypothetical protein
MIEISTFKKGISIWKYLMANNDTITFALTLFFSGFFGTVLIFLILSLLPGTVLTAPGVQFLIIGSLTSLAFLIAITLRIIFEWFAYARYKKSSS